LAKCVFIIGLGVLLRQAVYWGEQRDWQDFSPREGYYGSKFLRTILYAYGEDATFITGCIYFLYGTLLAIAFLVLLRVLKTKRR
jgi:hypothetical protein